ncbi:hypothetical protein GWK47_032797 [Chionoecetes opilio]|uniref:Uncharacterized protein n=1 Tax=Chionoecetes opilio TaxID=41210 RepID=A0A8J4YHN8_CHIOP|nr:hypothetical protein GWK47_032797 [Chionoecetes opilio]
MVGNLENCVSGKFIAFTAHLKMWSVTGMVHVSLSHYTVSQLLYRGRKERKEGLCPGEGNNELWSLCGRPGGVMVKCRQRLRRLARCGRPAEDFVREAQRPATSRLCLEGM